MELGIAIEHGEGVRGDGFRKGGGGVVVSRDDVGVDGVDDVGHDGSGRAERIESERGGEHFHQGFDRLLDVARGSLRREGKYGLRDARDAGGRIAAGDGVEGGGQGLRNGQKYYLTSVAHRN